jgi:DNA-binding winged helix-turn-helix (wHTH) protein
VIYGFAAFELDEDRRELRLRGREVFLQPRVFDLLLYLVRNRERVVGKDELLENVWPGVIVTEGSLQRAISLARSTLREGGAENAIRTFLRQGYRFCEEVSSDASTGLADDGSGSLGRARCDYEQGAWAEAIASFQVADCEGGLNAADLERWAYATQCAGRGADAVAPLQRAMAAHSAAGDRCGAARAALFLTYIQIERREFAVAKAWHRRAATLLSGEPKCREHGLLEGLASRIAFYEGHMEQAIQHAERAEFLGRKLADPDPEVLGLLYHGHALLALGDVEQAAALHDEAAAAVLAGNVSPLVGGVVYCGVIWGCRNLLDWQRAGQWTENFARWCQRSGLSTFSGNCRLHRAELLSFRGKLAEAEQEIQDACDLLAVSAPSHEGEALRILGDVRLCRGDVDGAEVAYRRAHELGWDSEPGYALLQATRGRVDAAIRGLERSLDGQGWSNRQRRGILLAHLAAIAAAAGRLEVAQNALEQLETERDIWVTPALAALRARAWAEVAFAEGYRPEAIASLRRALEIWREVESPLNVATLRLRLAQFFIADSDPHAAELELSAAESVFKSVNAPSLLRQCEELRGALPVARE